MYVCIYTQSISWSSRIGVTGVSDPRGPRSFITITITITIIIITIIIITIIIIPIIIITISISITITIIIIIITITITSIIITFLFFLAARSSDPRDADWRLLQYRVACCVVSY